jgi:hypothetical protein
VSRELPCSSKEITSLFVGYTESDLTSVSPQSVMISRLVGSDIRTCHRFYSDYGSSEGK